LIGRFAGTDTASPTIGPWQAQSRPRPARLIGVEKDDTGILEGFVDRGGGCAVQFVLTALESADGTTADLGTSGKVVLRPVQKRPCGAALLRDQCHVDKMAEIIKKVNIHQIG